MGYFFHEFKNEALNKAYELLENVTRLSLTAAPYAAANAAKEETAAVCCLFPERKSSFGTETVLR